MPKEGALTFRAEGHEGGPYHSRVPHVPSGTSGLTIGRGYDLKEKSPNKIRFDFSAAGMPEDTAEKLIGAAGMRGPEASRYIRENSLEDLEISREVQLRLFEISYARMKESVRSICKKADTVEKYGATNWDRLQQPIKDVLIDLRFRGDYHTESRKFLQKPVANNDLKSFAAEIMDKNRWKGVPPDRFQLRVNHLKNWSKKESTKKSNDANGSSFAQKTHVPTKTFSQEINQCKIPEDKSLLKDVFEIRHRLSNEADRPLHRIGDIFKK